MEKIFSGTTEECFIHYLSQSGPEGIEKIGIFLKTKKVSVEGWFLNKKMPIGERLMFLRVYLSSLGYYVEEFEKKSEIIKMVSRIIAMRILTENELLDKIGYDRKYFRMVLYGSEPLSNVGRQKIPEIIKDYSQQIAQATEKIQRDSIQKENLPSLKSLERTASEKSIGNPDLNNEQVIESLSHLVQAMIPLVDYVLSNRFTPEERDALRKKAGRESVFNLKVSLSQLCGERARLTLTKP